MMRGKFGYYYVVFGLRFWLWIDEIVFGLGYKFLFFWWVKFERGIIELKGLGI